MKIHKKPISAITLRILAINLTAVVMLGFGILYVLQYEDRLIEAELDAMKAEAQLFAGALAEGATHLRIPGVVLPFQTYTNRLIMPNMTRRMVRRFGEAKGVHVTVFDSVGDPVADSEELQGPEGTVRASQLPPPESDEFKLNKTISTVVDKVFKLIPRHVTLDQAPMLEAHSVLGYPDAISGLEGRVSSRAWMHPEEKEIYLSAAAPIRRVRHVMGVVYLTKPASSIEDQVRQMQFEIMQIFMIVLAITIVFSLYLSRNMAGPLKKLAFAAHTIRNSKNRDVVIPDMSRRQDEIGELSLALRDMTDSLWQRMDAIEGFAADVSHELKNPLTSLRSAVETARKIKDKDSLQTLMDIILHDVQRLDRLISDISRASRLDAELSKDEMEGLNLTSFFERMRNVQKFVEGEKLQEKDIELIFHIDDAKPMYIWGNETRLMQVFDNIIANAITFSPKGGKILIDVAKKDGHAIVSIEDEGSGIPSSKLETIFDRFYTERPQEENYGVHSGLGLSIAKQIIDAHQGVIKAENVKKNKAVRGARFTVEIPLADRV